MKEFWNQRYSEDGFAYGTAPNVFFARELDKLKPGKILMPAEGEGRNAVYAAQKGWEVTAFDISDAGREKALQLAKDSGVEIEYLVGPLESHQLPPQSFDAIGLTFVHLPPDKRLDFHCQLVRLLKHEGKIILEGFSVENLRFRETNPQIGGPPVPEMLFTEAAICEEFAEIATEFLETTEVELDEGKYHVGRGSVVRFVGKRQ